MQIPKGQYINNAGEIDYDQLYAQVKSISCAQILENIHEKFSSVDVSQSPTSSKNKGVFPSDTALEKLVYLAYRNISEKWTMPLANWALISQQLAIKFGDRFEIM